MTMSNPAKAPTHPLTQQQLALQAQGLDAYLTLEQGDVMETVLVRGADLSYITGALAELDMAYGHSVVVPKAYSTENRVLLAVKPKPYSVNGAIQGRRRTVQAGAIRRAMFAELPVAAGEGFEFLTQEVVRRRCAQVVRYGGGPINCIGRLRKYYPNARTVPPQPVRAVEAAAALRKCGIDLSRCPAEALLPYELGHAARPITINLSSSNGLPVMGKFEGVGAEKVVALMKMARKELDDAYARDPKEGVWDWLRAQEEDPRRSWLVTLLGRCKTDFYKTEKVREASLRFYNVFPRQLMLIMQGATQVLEANGRSIADDDRLHTFSGASFVHGGADRLVAQLDAQLARDGRAFVHMGDDSWVVLRLPGGILMFDLDCSSFDLTQHGTVTEEVHAAFRDQLSRVDPVAAQLWYALMRTRLVLTAGSVVRRWTHGGPSGAPLQSKVNDVLMHVMIERVLARRSETLEEVREAVSQEGARMGFVVRMDNAHIEPVGTVRAYLVRRPFLFVGYYLYNARGRVQVVADVPRTMAQMVYPNLDHMQQEELEEFEAVRLGSLTLSFGEAPPQGERAYDAMRSGALALLDKVLANRGGKDVPAERARWAIAESAAGPTANPSLVGLREAVMRGPGVIWSEGGELPSSSVLVPLSFQATVEAMKARRAVVAPARTRGSQEDAVVHGPSLRNAGRPPGFTFWAPDRPPALRGVEAAYAQGERRGRRKGGYKGGVYDEVDDYDSDGSAGTSLADWY